MRVTPNIPLIWAKQIRDAGMIKNQALKILKETQETTDRVSEHVASAPDEQREPNETAKKLDIV